MNARAERTFTDEPAVRGQTPMLFGLIGPSGSGKTYSALRLATGMRRVFGGEIFVIDTESGRAKHYADLFNFRHIPFSAPFSPEDYIAAIDHCEKKGAKIVIIDSMSHEHSGLGGVLEWHAAEVERLMAAWRCNEEKANIPAWGKPKAARRQLINRITQSNINFLLCFRARDKIRIGSGKVVQLGWMPDAGEEFVFELTAKSLLLPGAGGVPTLSSNQPGEAMMIKIPEQFRRMFSGAAGKPLDERFGEELALWSSGQDLTVAAYERAEDQQTLERLEKRRGDVWKSLPKDQKEALKNAADAAAKRLAEQPKDEPTQKLTLDTALKAIQSTQTLPELASIYDSILKDFEAHGRELPVEIEAAQADRKAALEQEE